MKIIKTLGKLLVIAMIPLLFFFYIAIYLVIKAVVVEPEDNAVSCAGNLFLLILAFILFLGQVAWLLFLSNLAAIL